MEEKSLASFHEHMAEYRKQLKKGDIRAAYSGLMEYIMGLRTYLKNKYPAYYAPSSVYYGYMDMTYFSFFPESMKKRKLKIAIVFIHEAFRFEVWLSGYNKQVQKEHWDMFKESEWSKYHVVPTTKGVDSIVEHVLVEDPDFSDLDALTRQIEAGTMEFIKDVEEFLSGR